MTLINGGWVLGKRSVIEMLRTHILIDLHIVLIVRSCVLLKLCFVPLITLSQLYKCLFTISLEKTSNKSLMNLDLLIIFKTRFSHSKAHSFSPFFLQPKSIIYDLYIKENKFLYPVPTYLTSPFCHLSDLFRDMSEGTGNGVVC